MGDYPEFDTSWVPIVSGIIGAVIVLSLITTLVCYCCAGCAIYNRRRDLQMAGVTTVTRTGYGGGMWGRDQVVIVQQGNPQAQQPPPYFANPEYNPGYSQGQPQNPAYPVQPGTFQGQGQQYVQPQDSDSRQFMKPHTDTHRY